MSEVPNGAPGAREKDLAPGAGESKGRARKRRKVSYLTLNKIDSVDYKDLPILRRFLNDRGKILSSRQTGATATQQRMIARAIRRARELALIPYVVTEFNLDRREFSGRPHRGGERTQEPRAEVAAQEPGPVEAAEVAVPESPEPAPVEATELTAPEAPETSAAPSPDEASAVPAESPIPDEVVESASDGADSVVPEESSAPADDQHPA